MNRSTLQKLPLGEYLLCKIFWIDKEVNTPIFLRKQLTEDGKAIYTLRAVGSLGRHDDLTLFDSEEKDEDHYYNGIVYKTLSAMCTNSAYLHLHVNNWNDCYELELIGRYTDDWKNLYERFKIAHKSNHKTKVKKAPIY